MKAHCFTRFCAAVLWTGAAACGAAPDDGDAPEPIAFDASDVHFVGTSESLADVHDLEVLSDGSIWVLNSLEPFFVGFRPDGTLLEAHGTAGGGPEEFGLPSAFVTGGIDGSAWVLDLRRHALIEVSDSASSRSESLIPRADVPPGSVRGGMDMMSPSVRTAALGDEVILPRTSATMDGGLYAYRLALLGADLVALHVDSERVREVVALGEALGDPAAGFELTEGGFPLWYRLWAVCADAIRVYDRGRNEIRGFAPTGVELDPIALPPVAITEASPRQFARAIFGLAAAEAAGAVGVRLTAADSIRLMNELLQEISGTPEQLANYLPRYVDFRCSDDGTIWIQPFDLDLGGGGAAWLRIGPDGATQQVRLPPRFDAYRFTRERIWGVQRDALDVASVAWIELPPAS